MKDSSNPLNSLQHKKLNKIYWLLIFLIISFIAWVTNNNSKLITWSFTILLWLLVSIGSFLLGYLGFQLILFNDKQDAYGFILKDINEATEWLQQHGITIDT
ncbi:hypothetical protein T552_03494 [Pneumocystis carinii B80]|uniref:Dolichol-phosphate mannosyltransferase subunit 3 n=1 Tax=Pneumocystis carinii (strain B80) TaxID=1408658 RepID=A0A0W4ZB71_PNEC8|nr:hypothetical protein T552_03494 [Pneumocystis carinii B80]KTW25634.1 hypothetical protein T552_03494 [Pneumocystis carinii B80]